MQHPLRPDMPCCTKINLGVQGAGLDTRPLRLTGVEMPQPHPTSPAKDTTTNASRFRSTFELLQLHDRAAVHQQARRWDHEGQGECRA